MKRQRSSSKPKPIRAASCSQADVAKALASARPGQSVIVPVGAARWTFTKEFVIRCALILALLCSLPSWASIAYVSASHTVCILTTAGTTQTCTLGAATTAGNTVVVGLSIKTATRTLTSVVGSDATSRFYQYTPLTCNGSSICVTQAVCFNCPALTTVKPTWSGTTVFATTVEEYSGVGSIGIYAVNTGSSTNPSVSLTTSDANNWVVAATANLGSTGIPTHGTGAVGNLRDANRTGTTSSHVAGAANDNTAASPGAVANTVTITSGVWAAVGTELRSVAAPQQYIWPNCDSTHPCIINHYSSVMYGTGTGDSLQDIKLNVPPSLANNALVLALAINPSTTTISTPTDDKTNTWVAGPTATSSTSIESLIFYKCGAATGTSVITLHLSTALGSGSGLQITYNEVSGIATNSCVDGTATGASGLTDILNAGAITTTASNSLVYTYALNTDSYPESDGTLTWVVPDGATSLLSVNVVDKVVSAVQVLAAAGSVNPTIYAVDPSEHAWNDLAIAFKAASGTGTQPSGIHLTRQVYFFTPTSTSISANTMFPTSGNAMLAWTAYPAVSSPFTNVADGVTTYHNLNGGTDVQSYYSCTTTPSAQRRITYTVTNFTLIGFYDIAGAASGGGTPSTACFDTSGDITGSQTNAGDPITVTNAVTPTTSNGLVITTISYGNGPPSGVTSPSGAIFDSLWATGMTDNNNYNSGDAYIHYYNPNTSAVTYTVTNANATPSAWEAVSLAFKAPAAGGGVRKRVTVTTK